MIGFDHVRFHRAERAVLQEVSFTLKAGSVCAILGRNGAGKTTCVRLLSGELAPSSGAVLWQGQPLKSVPREALARRRAVLPQQSPLSFPFSVEEVAALGRFPHAADGDPARDCALVRERLTQVGLDAPFWNRSYLELSVGERQRVHLARALAQVSGNAQPSVLLLDEPVAALDLAHQHTVLNLARAFARAGNAVFAVLHDLNLAARYADRVMLLHEGRIFCDAAPADALTPENIETVFHVRADRPVFAAGQPWVFTRPLEDENACGR